MAGRPADTILMYEKFSFGRVCISWIDDDNNLPTCENSLDHIFGWKDRANAVFCGCTRLHSQHKTTNQLAIDLMDEDMMGAYPSSLSTSLIGPST
jgi:hypothetical protein